MNPIPLLCALALLPLAAAEPGDSPPAAAQQARPDSAPNAKGARLCLIHDPGHYTGCPYRLCLRHADGTLVKGYVNKYVAAIFHNKLPTNLQWMPGADDLALLHFREGAQSRVLLVTLWEEEAGVYTDEACAIGYPILEATMPPLTRLAPTEGGLDCLGEGDTLLAHLYTNAAADASAWEALCREQPETDEAAPPYSPVSSTHAYSIKVQRRWSELTLFQQQGSGESSERRMLPLLTFGVYGKARAEQQTDALLLRAEDGAPLARIPLPNEAHAPTEP